jgi:hypothetical protein
VCAERWRLASAPAWRIAAKAPATSAIFRVEDGRLAEMWGVTEGPHPG